MLWWQNWSMGFNSWLSLLSFLVCIFPPFTLGFTWSWWSTNLTWPYCKLHLVIFLPTHYSQHTIDVSVWCILLFHYWYMRHCSLECECLSPALHLNKRTFSFSIINEETFKNPAAEAGLNGAMWISGWGFLELQDAVWNGRWRSSLLAVST